MKSENDEKNFWDILKSYTKARIGLSYSGTSLNSKDLLEMKLALARAREAIYYPLDFLSLKNKIKNNIPNMEVYELTSQVKDREEYLKRPDKGRLLSEESMVLLKKLPKKEGLDFILADGLSPLGIEKYGVELITDFLSKNSHLPCGRIFLCKNSRVAIGDPLGEILNSLMTIVIIGERPGLTSFDSLGIYLTYSPKMGLTDADRNCISNICQSGLTLPLAQKPFGYLVNKSLQDKISGINLKEDSSKLFIK